jgi:hypothetical protein
MGEMEEYETDTDWFATGIGESTVIKAASTRPGADGRGGAPAKKMPTMDRLPFRPTTALL